MLRIASAAVIGLAAAACSPAIGTPAAGAADATRSFAIRDFDRVVLRSSDSVDVRHGDGFSVTARGTESVLNTLEVINKDGVLSIGRIKRDGDWRWGQENGARLTVVLPRLRGASLAGSGDMTVDRADGDFAANVAGSGDLSVGRVAGDRAKFSVAGSGTLSAAGDVRQVSASVAGSGDIRAAQLRATAASVSIAGSGNVALDVNGAASVSLIGSGNADLGRNARCTINRTGSGEARCGG